MKARSSDLLLLLAAVLLAMSMLGCGTLPGLDKALAFAQGLTVHPIHPRAIEIANDTRCDEQPATLEEAMAALTVPIVKGNPSGKQMAAPLGLLTTRDFAGRPPKVRHAILVEELAHYCQRRSYPGFDQLYLYGYIDRPCKVVNGKCVGPTIPRSDFRWAFEVAAKRARNGRFDIGEFVEGYKLYDLDRAQVESETRRAMGWDDGEAP